MGQRFYITRGIATSTQTAGLTSSGSCQSRASRGKPVKSISTNLPHQCASPYPACRLSACNSGFWPTVEPLIEAGVPAIIGVNGAIDLESTIEFCGKMYESLCLGLTLDEAVSRARVHVMQWDQKAGLFDWGLYMVYMPSPEAILFPRAPTPALSMRQTDVRRDHSAVVEDTLQAARVLDKLDFGEIMSVLTERRVLILGRFTGRRLKILNAIKRHLNEHPNRYICELFTFEGPKFRDLIESIVAFAGLSKFHRLRS